MKLGDREQDDVESRWLRAYRAKPRVLTEVGIKLAAISTPLPCKIRLGRH